MELVPRGLRENSKNRLSGNLSTLMDETPKAVIVFLDASVLITAALSSHGGSSRLIQEGKLRGFIVITSRYAYREAERNITERYPDRLSIFYKLAAHFTFVADSTESEVRQTLSVIDFKDASVLASALKAQAGVLVTLDRKHFIENKRLREKYPLLHPMTPGDCIRKYFVTFVT